MQVVKESNLFPMLEVRNPGNTHIVQGAEINWRGVIEGVIYNLHHYPDLQKTVENFSRISV